MNTTREPSSFLQAALADLQGIKKQGTKIIGYVPNGYMPEEMVYACGAVPLPLLRGGDHAPVSASAGCLARFLDPFCRAQIGYRLLNEPLSLLPEILVVPVTDNHIRAIADSWDFFTDVEVFRFGVPHVKAEHGLRYYLEGLRLLKERLERLTGVTMTDSALAGEIEAANRIRSLLAEISRLRRADCPPISGRDFIELTHRSLLTDRRVMPDILRSLLDALKKAAPSGPAGPRILLAGSTMALGDSKVVDLLEEAGASIVVEEFSEGLRNCRLETAMGKDPLKALADACFTRRVPDAFFRGAAQERAECLLKRIRKYRVDGVVWYTLMYRDSYDIEGYIFRRNMEKYGIPMLRLSSDYDDAETGGFRTRIETFVKTIRKA